MTKDSFEDLRVLDDDGESVPFLIQVERESRTRKSRKTWTANNPTARPLEDDGLEILIVLDEDAPVPDGIRLVSPLRNFEQRVRVYSSKDGNAWEPLGDESVIFDYSRYMDVRSDSVAFAASDQRHFRVVIDAATSGQESRLLELTRRLRGSEEAERVEKITVDRRPFRIERIEFWKEEQEERWAGDKTKAYPITNFRIEENPEDQQTIVFVETPRAPLTAIQLETSTRNFSRRVNVANEETRGKQSNWQTLSDEVLSRIDFRDLQRQELEISFPEARRETYRVVIHNRDSPPLQITGMQTEGPVYQLLFLASQGNGYRLVYGSETAESPHYDTASIQAVLNAGFAPATAELGEQQDLGGPAADTTLLDQLRNPKLLIGLIVILVAVLGLTLYSAVQRLDNASPE